MGVLRFYILELWDFKNSTYKAKGPPDPTEHFIGGHWELKNSYLVELRALKLHIQGEVWEF